jgi:hypothetical protein
MKKFSLKDFIACNSPCFACGELINFRLIAHDFINYSREIVFKPTVTKDFTVIDLHVGWKDSLRLSIEHKTNKFATNDLSALKKYSKDRKLLLKCECNHCNSSVTTNYLEFDWQRDFIKAVGINLEDTIMKDEKNIYQVYSQYHYNHTAIYVTSIGALPAISRLDTPLIPRSKFKSRNEFIRKIKTYILFS